jgi:response regulator of citrate/malate metabolism
MHSQAGKVIIVDDSPFFRVSMANFVRSNYSFDIEEVNSAKELIAFSKSNDMKNVVMIFLDLYLADGNGLETLKVIKQENDCLDIPFILVSARVDKKTVTEAFREGARDVVAKPINYEKLKTRLDSIIEPEHKVPDKKSIMDYYKQITMETKRAKRGNYDLSIILAGIFQKVDFKSLYKDSSYQKVIDLEKKYPEALQKTMRETDAIIGLSPSEYLFILPFTDNHGTFIIRDKITDVFVNLVAESERNNLLMVVGTATLPEDGETTDQLIAKIEADFKKQFVHQSNTEPHDHPEEPVKTDTSMLQ